MPQSSRTSESYVTTPDAQFIIQNLPVDKIYKLLSTVNFQISRAGPLWQDRISGKRERSIKRARIAYVTRVLPAFLKACSRFWRGGKILKKLTCLQKTNTINKYFYKLPEYFNLANAFTFETQNKRCVQSNLYLLQT